MSGFAWVTLATNDSYSLGALVLAHSLRRANTIHQLAVLITPGVTEAMRQQLSAVYNVVQVVDVLDSKDEANLKLLARPELGITFTKLNCWRLTQFSKCVFLDADTLVLQNCDELFEREELSAAPDAGWPDCFNSGVFVFQPSNDTFRELIDFSLVHGSFDGGDQGLLNLFFKDWATKDISKHLPFVYNMCSTATYSYLPAFKQFGENLKIVHFIGSSKPWLQVLDSETGLVRVSGESYSIGSFIQLWWDLFCTHVHTSLSTEMGGLAGALASVTLGAPLTTEQTALQEHLRRQGWEQGNIDYMGRDSFDNIWQKITETLQIVEATPQAEGPSQESEPKSLEQISQDIVKSMLQTPPESEILSAVPSSVTPPVTATDSVSSSEITLREVNKTLPHTLSETVPSSSSVTSPPTPFAGALPSPIVAPTTPTAAATATPATSSPVVVPVIPSVAETATSLVDAPTAPAVATPATPSSTSSMATPTTHEVTPLQPKAKPEPLVPAAQPESPPITPTKIPPHSPINPSQKATLPQHPAPLTPPTSPKMEVTAETLVQPSTPTVTSPTPPTSPPVDPFEAPLTTKLKVDTETPGTPPAGGQPSTPAGTTDEPPVPPKRKGAKSSQEQPSKAQTKSGKPGKGKK